MGKYEAKAIEKIVSAFYGQDQAAKIQAQAEAQMNATARVFSAINEARYATPGTKENRAYHTALAQVNAIAAELRAKARGRK